MGKKIFITAGELSGDLNASLLVKALRARAPELEFIGIGGPKMKEAGVRLLADSTTWGSIGMLESALKFPRVYPYLRAMPAIFGREAPDLYIPVDYRFFSIRCAAIASKMNIPVAYYFAPVSWFGTGGKRFRQMAGIVDLALLALPFSLDDYKSAGIRAEYIGHPLLDAAKPSMSREDARTHFGLKSGEKVVGFMPGSRFQEIGRLTPVLACAAKIMNKELPGTRFLLFPAAPEFEPLIKKRLGDAPVDVVHGSVYDFMNVCDVMALCSGTAAHEACMMGTPMIVTYKLSAVTAWIVRKTLKPEMIAMPNILAGEFIVPEILQEECTGERVAQETLKLLTDEAAKTKMKSALERVLKKLGEPGVADRAAEFVLELLGAT